MSLLTMVGVDSGIVTVEQKSSCGIQLVAKDLGYLAFIVD